MDYHTKSMGKQRNPSKKDRCKKSPGCKRPLKKEFQVSRRKNRHTDRSGYVDTDWSAPPPKYSFKNKTVKSDMQKIINSFIKYHGYNDFKIYLFGSSVYGQLTQNATINNGFKDLDFGIQVPTKYDCALMKLKFKKWL